MNKAIGWRGAWLRLLPALLLAAAGAEALAGPADLEGALAFNISGDRITVEIERIANNTRDTTTGTLYVTVWMTTGTELGRGWRVARHRITGSSNGTLGPGQYFSGIRWTLPYQAPPAGTYYVHFFTSQHPAPNTVLDSYTFTNPVEVPGGPADIEGRVSYRIDGDTITVEIERIANNTASTTTGTLHVTVRMTADRDLHTRGHRVARHRITGSSNGTLGPGQYFGDIRWTLPYQAPPSGTYYVHFYTSQHPEPNTVLDSRTFADTLDVGGGGVGDDHGNSRSAATVVSVPGMASGRIDPADDEDYFRFSLTSDGGFVARSTGDLDTVGTLYDAGGTALATNDDSTDAGFNFRIEETLAAGTYYVAVQSFQGRTVGDYELHLSLEGSGSPDLVVESLSASAGEVAPGERFTLTASVRNRGDAESPAATAAFYSESGERTLLDEHSIPALAPAGAERVELRLAAETAPGTYAYAVCVAAVAGESNTSNNCATPVSVRVQELSVAKATPAAGNALGDFNGDGKADVLMRHGGTGQWHYYPMDGRAVLPGAGAVDLPPDLAIAVAGIGDFNGDGRDDVLMRRANGTWHYYPMNARRILAGRGEVPLESDRAWSVAGIGDFNGDGKDDVLLRHRDSRWHYYPLDGRRVLPGAGPASLTPNASVTVAGIGDMNGDGRDDVLVRRANGTWYYYPMNGRRILAGRGEARLESDLAWSVAGIGDFDGDGKDDVLLRHSDSRWRFYPMDGRRVRSGAGAVGLTPNASVTVAGVGDMNGDGRDDVLVRRANGTWYYYPMNGRRTLAGRGNVERLTSDTAWAVAGAGTAAAAAERLSIAADAGAAVQPFETVSLTLRGGAVGADHDILVDLSGTGGFNAEDTIEVAPVRDAAGRLLLAAPLAETLAEGNTERRFAVRVRERSGDAEDALSNTLTLALGETIVPANLAGHPTIVLEVILETLYESLDDPLLTVEAGAIEPGRSVRTASALGLSTAYSDAQAAALLESLFGVSLVAPSASGERANPAWIEGGGALARRQIERKNALVRCKALTADALCDAFQRLFNCAGDAITGFGSGSVNADSLDQCARSGAEAVVEGFDDYAGKIRSVGNFLRRGAPRLARRLGFGKPPAQQLLDLNATVSQVIGLNKTQRVIAEGAEGLRETWEAMRDATKALTEGNAELVTEAEQEIAANGVDDAERDAYFALVDEADHHQSDAAAFDDLEDVYTGAADVVEALGRPAEGGGGTSAGATCGANYEEFPVDDKTSTCVWNSLVEWNCYAGSRQVSHPDLGDANACLYYSLDFFQPDGTCRENYANVTFLGRETCRWAELGADKAAWYTLEKEEGVKSPQTPPSGAGGAPGESFRDCDTCPPMVSVPAGSFLMGAPESEPWSRDDERPQRTVSIPSFAMGAYEVTFAEWDRCVAEGGCGGYSPDDEGWGRGDRPVIIVSWDDAQLYVAWLSRKTGETYRLPTEAEWEYAARASTTSPFNTGGTISSQQANFDGRSGYPDGYNEGGLFRWQTVPVGSFASNAFGLHDVHGNVWEWVQDCFGSYGNAPSDGRAAEGGGCSDRVLRGGSWFSEPWFLRSANRDGVGSGYRDDGVGFRVVRTLAP